MRRPASLEHVLPALVAEEPTSGYIPRKGFAITPFDRYSDRGARAARQPASPATLCGQLQRDKGAAHLLETSHPAGESQVNDLMPLFVLRTQALGDASTRSLSVEFEKRMREPSQRLQS